MTPEMVEEFYKRAAELGALTEEQKVHILLQMVAEGTIKMAISADITKEQFIDAVSEHFNVQYFKGENDESQTKSQADGGQAGTAGN